MEPLRPIGERWSGADRAPLALSGAAHAMEDTMNHSEILSVLSNLDHVSAVYLVGRRTCSLPCQDLHVVLPDLHLLSALRSQRFSYAFDHDKGSSDSGRQSLITELLATLSGQVHLIQIGDLFDVWREDKAAAAAVASTLQTYPWASGLLDPSVDLLLGNHDHVDDDVAVPRAQRALLLENERILLMHGDAVDPIEYLPDPLQKDAVNSVFGQLAGSREFVLQGARLVQSEQDVGDVTTSSHKLSPGVGLLLDLLKEGNTDACAKLGLTAKRYDIRAVVIGHTHNAGVVAKASGSLLVDCGAWVERCIVSSGSPAELSAQLAVIAPTPEGSSTDFRVYQLTIR